MKQFHQTIKSGKTWFAKKKILSYLKRILLLPGYSSIYATWFGWITGKTQLNLVHDFCRNPFPDIRFAAVTLLLAICGYDWGIQAVSETAGFVEYLLDRHEDFDKEVKQEKYAVIKLLANSGQFDAQTTAELKKYVSQGAFFVVGQMEVAVEGF